MAMIYETNSLQHFGIKGQKWGLRRFQEEDGTLTEAGKARYGVSPRDGKISGVASEAASGKAKKENPTDEKKQKRKDFLKKAAVGLGAAALVGASAAALKKSTDLRDELRAQASKYADAERADKRVYLNQAKNAVKEASMFRAKERLIKENIPGRPNTSFERRLHAIQMDHAEAMKELARRAEVRAKRYDDIAINATRRKAVQNYIRHHGSIYLS